MVFIHWNPPPCWPCGRRQDLFDWVDKFSSPQEKLPNLPTTFSSTNPPLIQWQVSLGPLWLIDMQWKWKKLFPNPKGVVGLCCFWDEKWQLLHVMIGLLWTSRRTKKNCQTIDIGSLWFPSEPFQNLWCCAFCGVLGYLWIDAQSACFNSLQMAYI